MNELICIQTKDNRTIKLNYVQQSDGSWVSKMTAETMQDIKDFYPDVLSKNQKY